MAERRGDCWRLLRHGAAAGPYNMGVDEALLETAVRTGLPTLRFYLWDGPWLSLGYGQRLSDEVAGRLERAGVGCVRRVTGGRAVLHGADLTYAVAAPEALLPRTVHGAYRLVSDALLAALRGLGVPADGAPGGPEGAPSPGFDCFATPAVDEICVRGRKLAGSAQRRVAGGILQHGSVRLAPDPPAAAAAVAPGGRAGTSLAEEGFTPTREALEAACVGAFEAVLGASLEPGVLSPAEERAASARADFGHSRA